MSFTPFDRSVPQGTAPRAIWSLSPVVTDAAGDHGSKSEKRTGGGFVAPLCSSVLSYWYSASSYACSTDPSDTVSVRWIKQVEIETIHFRSVLPAIFRSESIAQPATMDHECGDQSQIGDVAIQDEVATYSIAGRYASGRSWSMIGSVVCVLSSTSTVSLSPSSVSLSPSSVSLSTSSVSLSTSTVSPSTSSVSLSPSTVSLSPSTVSLSPSTVSLSPSTVSLSPSTVSLSPSTVSLSTSPVSLSTSTVSLSTSTTILTDSSLSAQRLNPRQACRNSAARRMAPRAHWSVRLGSGGDRLRFPYVWVLGNECFPSIGPTHPVDRWLIDPEAMGKRSACHRPPLVVSNAILIISQRCRDSSHALYQSPGRRLAFHPECFPPAASHQSGHCICLGSLLAEPSFIDLPCPVIFGTASPDRRLPLDLVGFILP
jgi:hypothetical protein